MRNVIRVVTCLMMPLTIAHASQPSRAHATICGSRCNGTPCDRSTSFAIDQLHGATSRMQPSGTTQSLTWKIFSGRSTVIVARSGVTSTVTPGAGSARAMARHCNSAVASAVDRLHPRLRVARAGRGARREDRVQPFEIAFRELHAQGGQIFLKILHAFRAGDGDDVVAAGEDPREGELRGRAVFLACNRFDALDEVEVL